MNSADQKKDEVRKDEVRKKAPFFGTPIGSITIALLLWIVSCVLAAGALLILRNIPFEDAQTRILLTYLAFGPSTLFLVLSVAFLLVGSIRWAVFGQNAMPSARINQAREQALLETISHRLLLSETAKKINFRHEDMAMLRQTIRDDIRKGEFNAAMVLVNELSATYGQLEESETFRSEIESAQNQDIERKVAEGLSNLQGLIKQHDFSGAEHEAARLQRLYPLSPAVADLPHSVRNAREQYKKDLERAFLQASEREEVDRALDIMQVLDKMLSSEEAEPFREVARGVIGKKRDNLGVQFKLAVHDKDWKSAVLAGEQIIKQFPNTRMADEVRELIDQLRANAAGQASANAAVAGATPITKFKPSESASSSGISYTVLE